MVDESRRTVLRALAAEAHVVRALSLEQEAHAATRVRCGEHSHVTLAVDIGEVLVERGVFCLLCVFSEDAEVACLKVGSHIEGVGVLRQTQLVRRVCHDVVVSLLMLVHPRTAKGKECALLLHLLEPLVYAYFEVSTRDERCMVPIAALLTCECLHLHALERTYHEASTEQRVVDAE